MIASKQQLEQAVLHYGLLPFFANPVKNFSVEEMAAPGMLFGESSDDYGCWEWKGPVIREQTTAYGKFFRRKAGFISLDLYPDFLNYRRSAYHVSAGSTEEMLLEIIKEHEGLTSTELKRLIFGRSSRRCAATDPFDHGKSDLSSDSRKRKSLEGPLQRLQMGGQLLIADFEYKYTACGNRYGWGVALYSTPEIWFHPEIAHTQCSPDKSFEKLCRHIADRCPGADRKEIEALLR